MPTMNADQIIERFDRAAMLLQRYGLKKRREHAPHVDLLIEARMRLEQAGYLLKRFRQLELAYQEKERALETERLKRPAGDRLGADMLHARVDELKLHGEAFYYFAARAQRALADVDIRFTAKGVSRVRNNLIEHPYDKKKERKHKKQSGVLVSFWMIDCDEGLVLNPAGRFGPDRGLYPNAKEFIEKLLPKIELATQ